MEKYKATPFTKDVQKLVQLPSISGTEATAQQHLLGQFQAFGLQFPESSGFSTWLQPVEGYTAPNLIAHKKGNGGKGSKKALILTGHIDTVSPAGEKSEWQNNDPWSGEILEQSDGKHIIHGLGVSDMKMGLVVLQHVFQELAQKQNFDCDLWFVSAINEELNGAGTESFAKWFKEQVLVGEYPEGIAAIFGEPRNLGSDKTTIGIGNKANDFLVASKITGSHHSSEKGPNVIEDIAKFTQGLDALNLIWQSQEVEEGFTPPHITPTKIETSNENLNSTPASGSLKMDLRTTPATQQISLEQVIALAKSLGFDVVHAENPAPGAYTSPESPLVKAFQQVLLKEGVDVDLRTSVGSTDAGFLQAIGIKETIMAGAGSVAEEHQVNEKAILEEGERAIGLTVKACLKWIEMQSLPENKSQFKELFSSEKPLMGMIHLPQLPGYDGEAPTIEDIKIFKQKALKDLETLHAAGFDSVILENHGDNPPPNPDSPLPEIAKEIFTQVLESVVEKAHSMNMPVGINIVYDLLSNIDIAHSAKADFVRIDVFSDTMTNVHRGITIQAPAAQIMQANKELEKMDGHHVFVLADVQVKHFQMDDPTITFAQSVEKTIKDGADGIVVTGSWTGVEPNLEEVQFAQEIASAKGIPVIIGSGLNVDNIQNLLSASNGGIVGTSIKTGEDVDYQKAKALIDAANVKIEEEKAA